VGIEHAIRGMRNPYNSWNKSDSAFVHTEDNSDTTFLIGDNDLHLATKLAQAGTDHGKFLRFIMVYADVTGPFYWWKEADTYRAGVEKDSCSTMHNIASKEFTTDDFSTEHLNPGSKYTLGLVIDQLNKSREIFLTTKDKDDWWQMIQLLPSSYNQKRTMVFSYAALRNIYHARRYHHLDEWHTFCEWIESLPYSELITSEGKD